MGTFGYATSAGSTSNENAAITIACKFALSETSLPSKISLYCNSKATTTVLNCAIYDDLGNNSPTNRKDLSGNVTITTSAGWVDFTLNNVSLTAGNYWLSMGFVSGSNWYNYYHAGASAQTKYKVNVDNPNPFGTPTSSLAWEDCIYATYSLPSTGIQKFCLINEMNY
jgi:hypothetical protein